MNQLVVSCSLSPTSRSAVLAGRLAQASRELGNEVELVDLRELELPFCDGDASYGDANVARLTARIEQADAIALAVPVYNYDVGGAARNLIAMTGDAFREKVVGIVGAAGGQRSYMSLMSLANSLMLDFRSVIVPRFVYATRNSFDGDELADPAIETRITALATDLDAFARALAPWRARASA